MGIDAFAFGAPPAANGGHGKGPGIMIRADIDEACIAADVVNAVGIGAGCNGVCVGEEAVGVHDRRLADALAPFAIPRWPVAGAALVRECAANGEGVDVHVMRDWSWLGTARDEGDLAELVEAPQRAVFDLDVTRLLLRRYRAGALPLIPIVAERRVDDTLT